MTTTRPEIRVEGSQDGHTWKPYIFKYKAGSPTTAPPIVGTTPSNKPKDRDFNSC
jgi:hypothetical protein